MTCEHKRTGVTDSRPGSELYKAGRAYGSVQTRRRECLDCGERFTTYEIRKEDLERLANGTPELRASIAKELLRDVIRHLRSRMRSS